MTIAMLLTGILLVGIGAMGHRKLDVIVPVLPNAEERKHQERVLRRGAIALQAFGILLLVGAFLALME